MVQSIKSRNGKRGIYMTYKSLTEKAKNGEKVILYHGSRGGIDGVIEPVSRARCDFGKGFYMGTNSEQARGLVIEDATPVFYTVEMDFSKIPPQNILILEGQEWLYTVLAFRKKAEEFSALQLAQDYIDKANKYDIIIGAIADDRMNDAVNEFSNYALTDKGFAACLTAIDFGYQVVAKTKCACEAINIVSSRDIFGKEADDIRKYTREKRQEAFGIVTEMKKKYQRDGNYLNEIIEKEKEKNQLVISNEANQNEKDDYDDYLFR